MEWQEVMRALEACGTAQNRKVYARHGVSGAMFGVSYANLYAWQKKLKTNHALAEQLWATGNHDAQVLATLIADPKQLTAKQADDWAKSLDNYPIGEMFARFIANTPLLEAKAKQWHKAKSEWTSAVGWTLVAHLALHPPDVPDAYFAPYLQAIERDIHTNKNRVRHEMNGALIAIGLRNAELEKLALAVAKKIGKVEVDHGATNCKTPDAAEYIAKTQAYRHQKKKRAKA
jgi:3-methyladenine DNA glycosylase AlkD